jgi:hypothetical protein
MLNINYLRTGLKKKVQDLIIDYLLHTIILSIRS